MGAEKEKIPAEDERDSVNRNVFIRARSYRDMLSGGSTGSLREMIYKISQKPVPGLEPSQAEHSLSAYVNPDALLNSKNLKRMKEDNNDENNKSEYSSNCNTNDCDINDNSTDATNPNILRSNSKSDNDYDIVRNNSNDIDAVTPKKETKYSIEDKNNKDCKKGNKNDNIKDDNKKSKGIGNEDINIQNKNSEKNVVKNTPTEIKGAQSHPSKNDPKKTNSNPNMTMNINNNINNNNNRILSEEENLKASITEELEMNSNSNSNSNSVKDAFKFSSSLNILLLLLLLLLLLSLIFILGFEFVFFGSFFDGYDCTPLISEEDAPMGVFLTTFFSLFLFCMLISSFPIPLVFQFHHFR